TSLPFGLYTVKLKIGRQIVERVILLDASGSLPILQSDQVPQPRALSLPEITSAAPLPQTATTHEYQRQALDGSTPEAAKVDRAGGGEGGCRDRQGGEIDDHGAGREGMGQPRAPRGPRARRARGPRRRPRAGRNGPRRPPFCRIRPRPVRTVRHPACARVLFS